MPRRVNLPEADDLFGEQKHRARESRSTRAVHAVPEPPNEAPRRASGRIKHDEKMTVYVTADELMDIEQARLTLRRHHGLAVDRGRLVREALHLALEDLEARGAESDLVVRLCEE